ncbi:FecR family protein [Shinella sp. BYT-45]|uniref:FecR family protein n=1 Tax=Shinella sp. BYT-45 TaxID=3377377 RepID=UPI00398172A0
MEALEWFVRIKDEKASPEDRRAFAQWIAADPAHAAAYERAQALWDRFDIIKPEYERLRKAGRIGRRDLLLGGLVAAIVMPGAYVLTRPGVFADHTTGIGERRTFTLADGSTVELGSYSSLSVNFTGRERRLTLHRGQGFFTVAPDVSRPFVAEAGAGATRALGTQFDVKSSDDTVTVTVVEHSVSVELPAVDPVEVGEGWQVSYSAGGIDPVQRTDLRTAQAWRQDRIVFEDVPLRTVLRELERYRRGRIVLMDDSIGNIPVTAIFETQQAEAALRTIADTLPIHVLNPDGIIAVVYRR